MKTNYSFVLMISLFLIGCSDYSYVDLQQLISFGVYYYGHDFDEVESSTCSRIIEITSNQSWTANCSVPWATLSSTSGGGNGTINVSISENLDPESRVGQITIQGTTETVFQIPLMQKGVGYHINVDKSSVIVGKSATVQTFTIDSNDSWTISYNSWWFTVTQESNNTINVSISSNGGKCRSGAIEVKGVHNVKAQIDISQEDYDISGVDNGHSYVDLGLSSGTLWATCNVGATSPEKYGSYLAWGETTPKTDYDWSTYKYCNGTYDTLTKYCTSSSYGTVDNKTVLDPEDDAATANWGGAWRMPTMAELFELHYECTWAWTTRNGVKGYWVEGPNGNSIFLPAAGYRGYSGLYDADSGGHYWSSSLDSSYSVYAYYLYFYSSRVYWEYKYREYGRSVRPVCQ